MKLYERGNEKGMSEKTTPIKDLALCAFLNLKFPVLFIDFADPNKVIFHFEDSAQIQDVINDFWNGKITVDPVEFFNSIKAIKSRIFGGGTKKWS